MKDINFIANRLREMEKDDHIVIIVVGGDLLVTSRMVDFLQMRLSLSGGCEVKVTGNPYPSEVYQDPTEVRTIAKNIYQATNKFTEIKSVFDRLLEEKDYEPCTT